MQHSDDGLAEGSDDWQYVPELQRHDDEPGYDATLVSDAHSTDDFSSYGAPTPDKVIAHTNLYWRFHSAPGRTAGTVTTAEVDFG